MTFTLAELTAEISRVNGLLEEGLEIDGYELEGVFSALGDEFDIPTDLGTIKFVDEFIDPVERDGTPAFLMFKVGDDPRTFAYTGYYSSYGGSEWDGDIEEVEVYTQSITRVRTKR